MKITRLLQLGALALGITATALGQGTTAFTYQGRLNDGANPATGIYDLRFTLYDSVGIVAGPVDRLATSTTNGLFTVTLDFGAGIFAGPARWMEIAAKTNGVVTYVALSPRQPLTPTPYALYAAGASTAANATLASTATLAHGVSAGAVTSPGIAAGQVVKSLNTLKDDVMLAAGDNLTLASIGQTLTLSSPSDWHLTGNAGTTPGINFLGTTDSQPLEFRVSNVRALRLEVNSGSPTIIGGSSANTAGTQVYSGTIGGGDGNTLMSSSLGMYGPTIAGGRGNIIEAYGWDATIGGGFGNRIQYNADQAAIAGGNYNLIGTNADASTIAGGYHNLLGASASHAAIGGGYYNAIADNAHHSVVAGGLYNTNYAAQSCIGGGQNNLIWLRSDNSVIGGGTSNSVGNVFGFIGGGWNNQVVNRYGFIGGGGNNVVNPDYSAVAGGLLNYMGGGATNSFIGGGYQNYVGYLAALSTIGGGTINTIQAYTSQATIGGGSHNTIGSYSSASLIAGGNGNVVQGYAGGAAIGGGENNILEENATDSVLGGGWYNRLRFGAAVSVLGGGSNNRIETNSAYSVLAGGLLNVAGTNSQYGVISGGRVNALGANAFYATVPGGDQNLAAATNSFAAGHRAKATQTGSFVWADATEVDYDPFRAPQPGGVDNSFNVRASGGVYLATSVNTTNGQITSGVYVSNGGGAWVAYSDRNGKENLQSVNQREVLDKVVALPLTTWNYKTQDGSIRHLGPMAQDFKAAFGLGESPTGINTVDADGVALAAIQGLNQVVLEKDAEIQTLKARLDRLEQLINSQNGGGK
jgi:hypothetical protein